MKVLDVGCGYNKREGAVGIDVLADSSADIVHDLNVLPWPFDDSTFDEINANHVLEHLTDLIAVMEELHRIAKPGARIVIEVPYFANAYAFGDPTHCRFFSWGTFNYLCEGTWESTLRYTQARFQRLYQWIGRRRGQQRPEWKRPLQALLLMFVNRYPGIYERYLVYYYPAQNIYVELKVLK